jgi:hypothetical protein
MAARQALLAPDGLRCVVYQLCLFQYYYHLANTQGSHRTYSLFPQNHVQCFQLWKHLKEGTGRLKSFTVRGRKASMSSFRDHSNCVFAPFSSTVLRADPTERQQKEVSFLARVFASMNRLTSLSLQRTVRVLLIACRW